MLVADAIDTFIAYRQAENLSPKTIKWYREHLGVFLAAMPPGTEIAAVQAGDIVRFLAAESSPKREPRPLAPYTVRARYSTLRALFYWLDETEDLPNPMGGGRKKKVKPPRTGEPAKKYITYEDYLRYVAAIDGESWQDARDKLLGMVLYWTGVRLQECIDLETADIDVKYEMLRVKRGKGRKPRYIPIAGDIIRPALLDYLYLRPHINGNALWLAQKPNEHKAHALTPEGLRQILIRRCDRAGIAYFNPHSWRHGFGMWMINCGASISAVSRAMGHTSTVLTESVYAQMQTPAVQREYAAAVKHIRAAWGKPLYW